MMTPAYITVPAGTRITVTRNRTNAAYADKLDGKISEQLLKRKMADWRLEEQLVKLSWDGLKRRKPRIVP